MGVFTSLRNCNSIFLFTPNATACERVRLGKRLYYNVSSMFKFHGIKKYFKLKLFFSESPTEPK